MPLSGVSDGEGVGQEGRKRVKLKSMFGKQIYIIASQKRIVRDLESCPKAAHGSLNANVT